MRPRAHGDRDQRALVVRAVFGDFLRARAKRRDRDRDRERLPIFDADALAREADLVVEPARDARHRRRLADEIRERDLDASARRLEQHEQRVDEIGERRHRQRRRAGFAARLEQRDQPRHVRALAVRGKRDVDVAAGDRRLRDAVGVDEAQRIAQARGCRPGRSRDCARRRPTGRRESGTGCAEFRGDS